MEEIKTKKCCRCKRDLPADTYHFFKNCDRKDGLLERCKECQGRKFTQPNDVPDGYKRCSICKTILPQAAEYFWKSVKHKDGFESCCKKCHRGTEYGIHFNFDANRKELLCKSCGKLLPLTREYFLADKENSIGFQYTCKECKERIKIPCGTHKICSKCHQTLPLTDFYWSKYKYSPDGWQGRCKVCMGGKYQHTHHPLPDIDGIRTCVRCGGKYPLNNKFFSISKNNKGGLDRRCNKCKGKEQNERCKIKRKTNINFCIAQRCRERIYSALAKANVTKSTKTIDLLGCSFIEYRKYIESKLTEGMTMELYLSGEIEMDHEPPLAYYDLTDPIQQKIAFHYTHTFPMFKGPNSSKNSWYNGIRYLYDKSKMQNNADLTNNEIIN